MVELTAFNLFCDNCDDLHSQYRQLQLRLPFRNLKSRDKNPYILVTK